MIRIEGRGIAAGVAVLVVGATARGEPCGAGFVHTYEVQGVTDVSPALGALVEVEGIVTADGRGGPGAQGDLDGVFIQDREGDADPFTSDGLFVYTAEASAAAAASDAGLPPNSPLLVGARVRVRGAVEEYAGETQLRAEHIEVCASETALEPSALELPAASVVSTSFGWAGDLEAAEGMLVVVPTGFVVSDVGAFSRYGMLTAVYGELPWVFTHRNAPDPVAFTGFEQALARRTLVLDDGGGRATTLAAAVQLGLGATLDDGAPPPRGLVRAPRSGLEGSRGAYRLLVVNELTWRAPSPAAPAPPPESRQVRIVAANLHNLFKDGGDAGACYPAFDAESCRGAESATDRALQLSRSAAALADLEPDVIAASEVENDFGAAETTTWQLWVDQLNLAVQARDSGCQSYAPVLPEGYHGGDAIAVALAYCSERFMLSDWTWPSPQQIQGWGPGVFAGPNASRLPIAARFVRRSDGRALRVAVNHLKSRLPGELEARCPNPTLPDCDAGDGQGYFNHARQQAAAALGEWLRGETFAPSEPLLVVGDLNSYAQEAPIATLTGLGYRVLTEPRFVLEPSYVFDGRLGTIDHALASVPTLPLVERVGVAMVNVGPGVTSAAYSDHNPVFVDLDLDADAESACDCAAPGAVLGSPGDDVLWGSSGADVICGFGGNDVVFGLGGADCISGGPGDDWLLGASGRLEGEHVVEPSSAANSCEL